LERLLPAHRRRPQHGARPALAQHPDPGGGTMSALALATLDLGEYTNGLNARLKNRSSEEVLRLAIGDLFPGEIALVSSFGAEAAVLLHLVAQVDPATPVLVLDTGKLFEES